MIHEGVPRLGRVPEVEPVDDIAVVSTAAEVAPGMPGIAARLETRGVELDRTLHRLNEPLTAVPVLRRVGVDGERDPHPAGEELECIGETKALRFLDPPENVPALATSKTVEQPAGRVDRERRGLLRMERAHGHDRTPRPFDPGHLGCEFNEVGAFTNPINVFTRVRHQGPA